MSDLSVVENYKNVWGNRIGFGRKAALLVVDFMQGYTNPQAPLYAEGVVTAVKNSQQVLEYVRQSKQLIIHTNIRYHANEQQDGGIWVKKAPVMRSMVAGHPDAEFCPEVEPLAHELVITKGYASAFFGTTLASTLYSQGIDTVVLMGCSTSGCIRATAVDAVQHGFRVIVLRDCVGDRHISPHEANLFDIDSKYGDVIDTEEYYQFINKAVSIEVEN